jgi:hypothetical protein
MPPSTTAPEPFGDNVLTDEFAPLPGVDLLLLPGGFTARTALDGSFSFSFVAAGTYTLHASRLGYHNSQERVEVRAGQATTLQITLDEVPIKTPRTQVIPYVGFLECRWASFGSGMCGSTGVCGVASGCITTSEVVGPLWARDQNEMLFQLQDDDWEEILIEVKWQASTVATSPKMKVLFSYKERPGNHEFGSSNPTLSPIVWNFVRGEPGQNQRLPADTPKEPSPELNLRAWLAVGASVLDPTNQDPAGVAYETKYEMFVSVFYNQRAPEGYTAFPDA